MTIVALAGWVQVYTGEPATDALAHETAEHLQRAAQRLSQAA